MRSTQQDPGPAPRKVKPPPPGVVALITQLENECAAADMPTELREAVTELQALILEGDERAYFLGRRTVAQFRRLHREGTYAPVQRPQLYRGTPVEPCTTRRREPRATVARPRERRPGSTRATTSRRTRSTTSARSADPPPPADPPSAEDIEQGLLSLIYWSDVQAQRRAFEAALVELEDLLRGDRVDYEQIDAFVELHRDDRWAADYREEFPDWLGDEWPELFERDVTGMSFLREPWS